MGLRPCEGDIIYYFKSYKNPRKFYTARVETIIKPEHRGQLNKYEVLNQDGSKDVIQSWQMHDYHCKTVKRQERKRKGAITDV